MVQVNRVCLKILFINRPQFLVDSNDLCKKLNQMRNKIFLALFVACSCLNVLAVTPRSFWPQVFAPADAIVAQLDTCGPEIFADKKPLVDKLYLMARQHPDMPALLWRAKFWDAKLRRNTDNNSDNCIRLINEAYRLAKGDTASYDFHRIKLYKNSLEFRNNRDFFHYFVSTNGEIEYFSSIGDELRLANCYNEIGRIYDELGAPIQALENIEKSYQISIKYGSQWTYGCRHNMAYDKYKLGQKEEAISMLKKLEQEYKNSPDKNFYLVVLNSLCYFLSDKEGERNIYCEKLIEPINSCSDEFIKNMALINISGFYYQKKQYQKSIAVLLDLISYFDKTKDVARQGICLANVAECYMGIGDYRTAAEYYDKSAQLQLSGSRDQAASQVINAESLLKIKQYNLQLEEQRRASRFRMIALIVGAAIVILGLVGIILFYRYRSRKNEVQLENEQLKSEKQQLEIALQNKKLVATSMMLAEKDQALKDIKDHIADARGQDGVTDDVAAKINMAVNMHLVSDREWERFKISFEQVYPDFFESLKTQYPDLTEYDLRLCAFYMMGIDTKQIALMLSVQPLSVQRSRSRIRKKMALDRNTDFITHLRKFNPKQFPEG